jgi:fumarate reductase flavoprotein subunit
MKQLEADVVVVAGGTSGLAAAISAAEGGARVIVFEKAATTGGTGNMGNGLFAVESRHQIMKQVALTREEAFKIFMDYTHWRVDARLVKAYIDKSASTIDWLESMGVEFIEPAAYFPGAQFTWHIIKPSIGVPFKGPNGAATTMVKIMTDRAKTLGVQIFLQTPVKKILKEENRMVGVAAEDRSGEEIQASSRAVIIATGGFGDNPEMIKKYTEYEYGRDLFSFRIPGLNGDGLRMAWEAGAMPTPMNMEIIYGTPGLDEFLQLYCSFRQPGLVVNLHGERFMNEDIMRNTTFTGNAIATQKNRCAFNIYDEAIKKYYMTSGMDFVSSVFQVTKADQLDAEWQRALAQGSQEIFVADSIEELAGKAVINQANLKQTVAEYNKNARYLRPVQQPRFYAGRIFPGAYGSLGGIKINDKAEVLNKNYDAIPGLYAAGVDACTIYGDSYVFVLPGNTMGFAINSGRIAGESAAAYVKATGK